MEEAPASKLRRLEPHHRVSDALRPPLFFQMENLPEEIQPLVMSLLPLKEAVKTSIVSRSWRMLWTFHCNLCFDGTSGQSTDQDSVKIEQAKFIETVNWVIRQHSGTGLNKFGIRFDLQKEDSDHLDRWIAFAASSKAKIIDIDLRESDWPSRGVHHFPLEVLDAQGSSFVQSLLLAFVSIKPHSGICGFTKLRRLVLKFVQIFGGLPDLLLKCSVLEDLEIFACSGVANLRIPHQLDKLQHLLIVGVNIQMVEFHAADLAHFEYKGPVIPIVLHGCSKLEKATLMFGGNNALDHAFTGVPSLLPVKILNVQAQIKKDEQVHTLTTRPPCMFMHLRHLTCKISIFSKDSNTRTGIRQLAHYLDFAPQLETLHLDMFDFCSSVEVTGEESSHMRHHDHLKTVYMSGFRCYRDQVELACCILENAAVLEHMTIEPTIMIFHANILSRDIPVCMIRD